MHQEHLYGPSKSRANGPISSAVHKYGLKMSKQRDYKRK